jgi:hypothetical protein
MESLLNRIQAYFQDELSEEETIAFENELKNNPELSEKTAAYRKMLLTINFIAYQDEEIPSNTKQSSYLPMVWLGSILVLVTTTITLKWCSYPTKQVHNKQDTIKILQQNTIDKPPTPIQDTNIQQLSSPKIGNKDSINKITLPKIEKTEPEKEINLPQNPQMKQEMENSAEGGRGSKIKVKRPKNYTKLKNKVVFEWENENRKGSYTITIYDRYGDNYTNKTFTNIAPQNPTITFELSLVDFEPAFYFWELKHSTEEQPFTGGFIVEK